MQRIKVEIDKIFAPSDAYRNNCSTPKAANQLLGLEKDLYDLFKEIFEVIAPHTRNKSWTGGAPIQGSCDNNILKLTFGICSTPTQWAATPTRLRRLTCEGCNRPGQDFATIDDLKNDVREVLASRSEKQGRLQCSCYGVLCKDDRLMLKAH